MLHRLKQMGAWSRYVSARKGPAAARQGMKVEARRNRAVIFDMDGLMLDTERLALHAWQKAAAEYGYVFEEETYLLTVGLNAADSEALLARTVGSSFLLQKITALQRTLYAEEIATRGIPPKPGLFELLAALEAWGIPKAVATSTARVMALEILTQTNLVTRFPVIVGGDEVARGKPAPDILLEAAGRLDVTHERCIVLEDSEAGILAARAAGMPSILIPDVRPPSQAVGLLATRVVPSLHEARLVLTDWCTDGA